MADQKPWFKLWTSVCLDPDLRALSLEDFGRWCLLGALMKTHGKEGTITLPAPASTLQDLWRVTSYDDVCVVARRFPNCVVTPVTMPTVTLIIVWKNWKQYQGDNSAPRVQRFRERQRQNVTHKKRGEEIEIEKESKKRTTTPPLVAPPSASTTQSNGNGHTSALRNSALEVLAFLNRKAGRNFQPKKNLDFIEARLHDGATVSQCRAIIGRKVAKWKDNPDMAEYLRPATLFNETKFAQYLGELPITAFDPEPTVLNGASPDG